MNNYLVHEFEKDLSQYTASFQKHIELMQNAEMQFDKNPCSKTAKILSDLRHTKFTDVEKYTEQHLEKIFQKKLRQHQKMTELLSMAKNHFKLKTINFK